MGDLRSVSDVEELPNVELAKWFRRHADLAEQGEIIAAGIAFVERDRTVSTSIFDEAGCGLPMIAATALLAHRVVTAVAKAADDA